MSQNVLNRLKKERLTFNPKSSLKTWLEYIVCWYRTSTSTFLWSTVTEAHFQVYY